MNKKGMSFSDFVYFIGGAVLIVVGLLLLVFFSQEDQEENYKTVLSSKDGYQTIQLARTFTQTPMSYEGKSESLAYWINYYFTQASGGEKTDLSIQLSKMGSDIILPQLNEDSNSVAVFNYYEGQIKKDYLTVASVKKEDLDKKRIESVNYVSSVQENVTIQLPVYVHDQNFNPKNHKIELYIGIEVEKEDTGWGTLWK